MKEAAVALRQTVVLRKNCLSNLQSAAGLVGMRMLMRMLVIVVVRMRMLVPVFMAVSRVVRVRMRVRMGMGEPAFVLVVVIAVNGPGTGIGFDFPRTNLPVTRLGAANGVVIAGGFTGGTVLILVMGVFLDWIAGGEQYTAQDLRWAWMLQAPFFAIGIVGILLSRRRLRALMAAQGVVVPSWREVVERIRRSRGSAG